jgi:16S rRNA U516 pseudouridylate synthase RsuA-like enzyme
MPERLQKILAQSGYGTRRASEDFISAGRVRVNSLLNVQLVAYALLAKLKVAWTHVRSKRIN